MKYKIKYLTNKDENENEFIKNIIDDESSKFILCGHSMGCTLAQALGLYIIDNKKKDDYFIENCYIIGSGKSVVIYIKNLVIK